jgi:hypothetical protein
MFRKAAPAPTRETSGCRSLPPLRTGEGGGISRRAHTPRTPFKVGGVGGWGGGCSRLTCERLGRTSGTARRRDGMEPSSSSPRVRAYAGVRIRGDGRRCSSRQPRRPANHTSRCGHGDAGSRCPAATPGNPRPTVQTRLPNPVGPGPTRSSTVPLPQPRCAPSTRPYAAQTLEPDEPERPRLSR